MRRVDGGPAAIAVVSSRQRQSCTGRACARLPDDVRAVWTPAAEVGLQILMLRWRDPRHEPGRLSERVEVVDPARGEVELVVESLARRAIEPGGGRPRGGEELAVAPDVVPRAGALEEGLPSGLLVVPRRRLGHRGLPPDPALRGLALPLLLAPLGLEALDVDPPEDPAQPLLERHGARVPDAVRGEADARPLGGQLEVAGADKLGVAGVEPPRPARALRPVAIRDYLGTNKLAGLSLSGQFELELVDLSPEEQFEFLSDLGLTEGGRDRFIQMAYEKLELITFLTYGEDECRAWSLGRGSDAVEAAGKIHTDLARGFIRAEVIHYDDFMSCGCSVQGVKKLAKFEWKEKNTSFRTGICLRFCLIFDFIRHIWARPCVFLYFTLATTRK